MTRPTIGSTAGKVWGSTVLLFGYNDTECHLLRVRRGGYCSLHKHAAKWNRFAVVSGRLLVQMMLEDGDIVDDTVLSPGQTCDVPPGVRHRFEALEESVVLEFCWVQLVADDIDRGGTCGGVRQT